jgi:tetratricopeptide (TPR) repeat protein
MIEDKSLVLKVLTRRGLAYEQIEKFELAKQDMMKVKVLQPSNMDASRALSRINKAISSLDIEKKAGSMSAEKLNEQLNTIKEAGNAVFKKG